MKTAEEYGVDTAVYERAKALWERMHKSKDEMMAVIQSELMADIVRWSKGWTDRIEILETAAAGDWAWREVASGAELLYKLDDASPDCRQLFVPRWPIRDESFTWWLGMFTGRYFFRPEESPAARYPLTEAAGALTIDAGDRPDIWVYMPSKTPHVAPYAVEFDYTVWQPLRETLQLCFNFDSLASRFRFVLNYNNSLGFEVVSNGVFFGNAIEDWKRFRKPCSIKLGEPNHVRLEVLGDVYQLFFDGRLAMSARVNGHVPHPAHWAIIAWNGFENQPMKVRIENLRVFVRR